MKQESERAPVYLFRSPRSTTEADLLKLWDLRTLDTMDISKLTGLPESMVINRLARAKDARRKA